MFFARVFVSIAFGSMLLLSAQAQHGVVLTPLDPAMVDDSWRSTNSPIAMIHFVNNSGRPVDIYWINANGDRVLYKAGLADGATHPQPTYLKHPWLVVASGTGGNLARNSGTRLAGFKAQTPNPNLDPAIFDTAIIGAPSGTAGSPGTAGGYTKTDVEPKLIKKVEPHYSEAATKLRVDHATVAMRVIVQLDGTPSYFKVTSPFGYGLEESAIDCVREWRFSPGEKDGHAVPATANVAINFTMSHPSNANTWYSGPMAFRLDPSVSPPVVEDGSMPAPGSTLSDESVILEFTVNANGAVKDIHSIYGSDSAGALLGRYLANWKFRPAVDGANIVEATGRVRFIKGKGGEGVNRPLFGVPTLAASSMPASPSPTKPSPPAQPTNAKEMTNPKDGQTYVWIPPGSFTMGCSTGDTECSGDESPPHAERITKGFWLGQTEVTQAAYQRVTGSNPSAHRGDTLPVEQVTWEAAASYCSLIGGRLPTEAEWEYAARGSTVFARYGDLDEVAWYSGNSNGATHPVAMKLPNAFGLYDMLGNVWEWLADTYPGSEAKIERGGNAFQASRMARVSKRGSNLPTRSFYGVGFRCAGDFGQPQEITQAPAVEAATPLEQMPAPVEAHSSVRTILEKVGQVYRRLTEIHVSGKWEEVEVARNMRRVSEASYDLTAQGKDHHFLKFKINGEEAISASDGQTSWKALPGRKQWSSAEAASVAESGDDPIAEQSKNDLFTYTAGALFADLPNLARTASDVKLVREADYKLASGNVRCFVIHAQSGKYQEELWVDEERSLVVERTEKAETKTTLQSVRFKTSAIEINQKLPDSNFQLQPPKGWTEVETVLLPGEQGLAMAGQRAAPFTLKSLNGEKTQLPEAHGRPVVLDFWATWCPPCRAELPAIEKLNAEFGENVLIYGVNAEDAGIVKDFMKKNQYQMKVLMDNSRQVARLYGVNAYPTLLIIDKQGIIRKRFLGSRDEETLRRAIQSVVEAN